MGRWPIRSRQPVSHSRAEANEAAAPPPARNARLLALQRSAGNRAVASLLARDATPAAPKAPARVENHVTLPGIGDIPIESLQWGVSRPGIDKPEKYPGKQKPPVQVREVVITSLLGDHSPRLSKATLDGTIFDPAEIVLTKDGKPYLRIKLTNAIVSSYTVSGGGRSAIESWTLTAEDVTFEPVGDGSP